MQRANAADLSLTVTCHASGTDRVDLPALRWFDAVLALETLTDTDLELRDVAHAEVVLVNLAAGTAEAFLQADSHSAEIAEPLEHLIAMDDAGLFDGIDPPPRHVLVIDCIHVPEPEQGHGYAAEMLALLIDHFAFMTGHGIVLANPVPDGDNQEGGLDGEGTDPFTRRAAQQRLEHLLTTHGFHRPSAGSGATWWAEYSTPRR